MFMHNKGRAALCGSAAAIALSGFLTPQPAAAQAASYNFNIPAQDLASALRAFGSASRQSLVFDSQLTQGKQSSPVIGAYTADEALQRLLAGSGLAFRRGASGVVVISRLRSEAAADPSDESSSPTAEVVVTGSLIRGAIPAAPVQTITADQIRYSGFATLGEVLKTLPQDFGGGQNIGNISSPLPNSQSNFSQASTANLRGLGSDATLTLVDGHRLAYGDINNGVDLSLLPLGAIQRVEVLTDGASALYGSDAVAGVVNIILKTHFDGAETSVRYGSATEGGGAEYQVNQLVGKSWDTGHVIFGYEYLEQEPITSDQRQNSQAEARPSDLIPFQYKNSYFASATQDITPAVQIFATGLYTARGTTFDTTTSLTFHEKSHTSEHAATLGTRVDAGNWTAELSGGLSGDDDRFVNTYKGGRIADAFDNKVQSIDVTATGPLFRLPSGDVGLAVGADYRRETLDARYSGSISAARSVSDVYSELRVPFVAPSSTRVGLERLELSASGRYEDYSDLGSVAKPKVGLVYYPVSDLKLRASWGESFKAPTLQQEYGGVKAVLYPTTLLGPGTPTPSGSAGLIVGGSNTQLRPETAKTWTAGFDYKPVLLKGLSIGLTAYHIDYSSRIIAPLTTLYGIYNRSDLSPYIIKNPSATVVNEFLSSASSFGNYTGAAFNPANVVLIYDDEYQNAYSQVIDGVDLTGEYRFDTQFGSLTLSSAGSWLHIDQQNTPTSGVKTISGTIFYPSKFKFRGGATWSNGDWSASTNLNYVSGETDDSALLVSSSTATNAHVSSWTTVDAQVTYAPRFAGFLTGVRIQVAATNLFDRPPPVVAGSSVVNNAFGAGYDSANTNAIGRFLTFAITKDW